MTTNLPMIARASSNVEDIISRQVYSQISKGIIGKIKDRYGHTFKITRYSYGQKCIEDINNWIKEKDPKFKERLEGPKETCLKNIDFVINLDINTYLFVSVGKSNSDDQLLLQILANNQNTGRSESSEYDINLFVCGKKCKKYMKQIESILKEYIKDKLYMYSVSGGKESEEFNSIISDMHLRSMKTLFFENDIKEKVINHIQTFLDNGEIYEKRDLLYKTGILLYGDPGTGKSSLANAIATHFNDSLIVIDMTTFDKLDINTLSQSINADDEQYVILLEDIDCIFKNLDRTDGSNIDKDDLKIVNKLLQFTDSNSSPNNVIFVATTNHYEKLDEAITRKGRFDLQLKVGGINEDTARKMCKSFELSEESIDKIIAESEFPINQSKLQSIILETIKNNINNQEVK
nr:MAG TPA: ATPase [Caudoviricetes sp.]